MAPGPLFFQLPLKGGGTIVGGGGHYFFNYSTIFSTTPRGTFSTTFFIRRHMFFDFFQPFFSQKPLLFSAGTKMINKNHSLQARGKNDKTTCVAYFAEIVAPGPLLLRGHYFFNYGTPKGGLLLLGGHYC